jgi:hypothetical protein
MMSSLAAVLAAGVLSLDMPIACRVGETCFVQQYFDHDPGPDAKDYRCGARTYDSHDGTDFRLPTRAAQARGVDVLAAAPGVVKAARDGVEDVPVDRIGRAAVAGRECGNGVVLSHADGWETQYCHMAKGSVRVRPGLAVAAGELLGRVGESGDAAFPHLHLSVRHDGQKVDPFAYGAPQGSCGTGISLWSAKAAAELAYRSPQLINFGFADGAVTMEQIEAGPDDARRPGPDAPAIVAFARAIGLQKGDVLSLGLEGPGGIKVAPSPVVLDRDQAQHMLFAGVPRPPSGWPAGAFVARFTVTRSGRPALQKVFETRP